MNLSPAQTTCSSLLHELQIIWDEIGEDDSNRDKMLLQLEQECLDIYRRKVDKTRKYKALLHQSLAESEAEINSLVSALGERLSFSQVKGTIKEQLSAAKPILEDLRFKKDERMREFNEIQTKLAQIRAEIAGNSDLTSSIKIQVNEHDLTLRKLGELKVHLQELQNEKSIRLQKVNNHIRTIHQLSVVMSFDFFETVTGIHPSLTDNGGDQSKSISNDTLARMIGVINVLKQEKQQRLGKLQNLGSKLIDLWELMDTPLEQQEKFGHVTSSMSCSIDEVSMPGYLAIEVIEQAEVEVERLNVLKGSKMKELLLRRQSEIEEIYRAVHMDVNSDSARKTLNSVIESGNIDLSNLLSSMDEQIAEAKQQALSRRDILDRVEKWQHAALEEKWLDDYEKDENRYCAGRGAHINLKRAEKARILVGKIPSMMENLTSKIKSWEAEKGIQFLYNKVPLLCMLEEYRNQRKEREGEKHKYREQRRLQEQVAAEKEAMYGWRSAVKKPLGLSANGNNMSGTPISRRGGTTPGGSGRHVFSSGKDGRESKKVVYCTTPVNYVALQKDDSSRGGN